MNLREFKACNTDRGTAVYLSERICAIQVHLQLYVESPWCVADKAPLYQGNDGAEGLAGCKCPSWGLESSSSLSIHFPRHVITESTGWETERTPGLGPCLGGRRCLP